MRLAMSSFGRSTSRGCLAAAMTRVNKGLPMLGRIIPWRRLTRIGRLPGHAVVRLLATLLAAGGGCSAVPAAEFAGYRRAFDDARAAGEQVLLDYSAAKVEHAALAAGDGAPATRPSGLASDDRFALDIDRIVDQAGGVDEVEVRLQAWAVVAAYNDALTRLAEGRPPDEVGVAVGGLLGALKSFPVEALSAAAE